MIEVVDKASSSRVICTCSSRYFCFRAVNKALPILASSSGVLAMKSQFMGLSFSLFLFDFKAENTEFDFAFLPLVKLARTRTDLSFHSFSQSGGNHIGIFNDAEI